MFKIKKESRALSVNEPVYVRTIAVTGLLEKFTRIYEFEEQKRGKQIKFCSKIYSQIFIHSQDHLQYQL